VKDEVNIHGLELEPNAAQTLENGGRSLMATQQAAQRKQQALQTFLRDLPQLYIQRPGQWVAYEGNRQIGFAAQKHTLYQQCFDQGLQREEFVIFCIEPQETEMTLGPVILD
jgi:hypothetical protein